MKNWVISASICVAVSVGVIASTADAQQDQFPIVPGGLSVGTISQTDRIIVDSEATVCVSVVIDEDLWPLTLAEPRAPKLSGFLANQFRKEFSEKGKLGNPTRFRTNDNDLDPACNSDDSLYVQVKYEKNGEGMKFDKVSTIKFRDRKFEFYSERDISEEIRKGVLKISGQSDPIRFSIFNDLRSAAHEISIYHLEVK